MNVITGLEPAGRTPWARIALIWLCIAVLMVLINWSNIAQGRFLDPDDTLRLVQVRDLVGGQGWFDLHQYRVDPGASPVMHWSRLVDTPLALAVLSFRPWFGQAMAEQVAVVIVPLLTLLALMAIVGRIAYRVFDREIAGLACLSLGFSPLLLAQFQPLRIDHHAWQVVSVMFAIGALMQRNPRIGGALAGIGIATGMSISLEVLPLAAIVGAVLLLRWLRDPAQRWWSTRPPARKPSKPFRREPVATSTSSMPRSAAARTTSRPARSRCSPAAPSTPWRGCGRYWPAMATRSCTSGPAAPARR